MSDKIVMEIRKYNKRDYVKVKCGFCDKVVAKTHYGKHILTDFHKRGKAYKLSFPVEKKSSQVFIKQPHY